MIQLSSQPKNVNTFENGAPIQGIDYTSRNALISAEDFLNGKDNYQEFCLAR